MIENAVQHYHHLREQGVTPRAAETGTMQRFGIDRQTLVSRLCGFPADRDETQNVLGLVRDRLVCDSDAYADEDLLRMLYAALTGETV